MLGWLTESVHELSDAGLWLSAGSLTNTAVAQGIAGLFGLGRLISASTQRDQTPRFVCL